MLIKVICNEEELKDEEIIKNILDNLMKELVIVGFKGSVQIEGEKK